MGVGGGWWGGGIIFMCENSMLKLCTAQLSLKNSWARKIKPGAKFSFSCMEI